MQRGVVADAERRTGAVPELATLSQGVRTVTVKSYSNGTDFEGLFAEIGVELADIARDFARERAFRATDGSSGNVLAQIDIAVAQVAAARAALHGRSVAVSTPAGERVAWILEGWAADLQVSRVVAARGTAGFHF